MAAICFHLGIRNTSNVLAKTYPGDRTAFPSSQSSSHKYKCRMGNFKSGLTRPRNNNYASHSNSHTRPRAFLSPPSRQNENENEAHQLWKIKAINVGVGIALIAAAFFCRANPTTAKYRLLSHLKLAALSSVSMVPARLQKESAFASASMQLTGEPNEGTGEIDGENVDKMKSWVYDQKEEALRRGIKKEVVESAFEGVTISERILEIDQNCPEVKLTQQEYLKRMVTDKRVSKGVAASREHQALLNEISSKYGVPAPVLVAIWGVESSFGEFTGGWDTIQALISMSYGRKESGKSEYFREEVFNALSIIEQGHGPPGKKRLQGSYAGAMGQCQFMPSSFLFYAVDYDGDGRADIWESYADVFASMANYLQKHGWKEGHPISQKVRIGKDIDQSLVGLNVKKPVCEWKNDYTVMLMDEKAEVSPDEMASLIAPDGLEGDAYLVYDNFRTIMRYNTSVLYSISIHDLTQKITSGLLVQEK